jgi:hypothetical protein
VVVFFPYYLHILTASFESINILTSIYFSFFGLSTHIIVCRMHHVETSLLGHLAFGQIDPAQVSRSQVSQMLSIADQITMWGMGHSLLVEQELSMYEALGSKLSTKIFFSGAGGNT